jgi:hypothetical protein
MLLSKQIAGLAKKLKDEAMSRPYVGTLIPNVADDERFWATMVELLEIVLHREDYVIAKREQLKGDADGGALTR